MNTKLGGSSTENLGSLSPKIWGNSGWVFLFSIASIYPRDKVRFQTKRKYYNYFVSLGEVLPCENCRHHYQQYLNSKPVGFYLENRNSLFNWLIGLHNKSNPKNQISNSEEAIDYYLNNLLNLFYIM